MLFSEGEVMCPLIELCGCKFCLVLWKSHHSIAFNTKQVIAFPSSLRRISPFQYLKISLSTDFLSITGKEALNRTGSSGRALFSA